MDSPLENLVGGGGALTYKKIQAREKLKGKNSCMPSNLYKYLFIYYFYNLFIYLFIFLKY